ncbi:hypothetical protein CCR75_002655 [Bremia lactucae]|uniref:Uncharacterized protein n=1 Tax=Bremia lactucae TaxID=4779 RepID=A0A976FK57_BRELC|nr:hypothetical protein CCR75_002655 [Bremia lactucae]
MAENYASFLDGASSWWEGQEWVLPYQVLSLRARMAENYASLFGWGQQLVGRTGVSLALPGSIIARQNGGKLCKPFGWGQQLVGRTDVGLALPFSISRRSS